ncbi:choice-of-anchor J domain-containing protein [Pontibacter sp. CAU 1760]
MVKNLHKLTAVVVAGLCFFAELQVNAQTTITTYPYKQDFNTCTYGSETLAGGWAQVSLQGNGTWSCSDFGLDGTGAMQMNGYDSSVRSSVENEDWLLSEAFNLASLPKPQLSFWSISKYRGPGLKLMVSTTYDNSGTINPADWTEVEAAFPAVDSDSWTQAKVSMEAYKNSTALYVAFVYTSGAGSNQASRWMVDNVEVRDVSRQLLTENTSLNFGDVAVGAVSATRSFQFKAEGYAQDVVLTAPQNFEISKDSEAFAQALTYTPSDAATDQTVYVRFKPATKAVKLTGAISFTSGTELNEQRGSLAGSSILRDQTLDIVTWNIEWFGSAGNGPSDDALQFANAKKVLQGLEADIIGVQEISDSDAIRKLAEEMGYGYETMETEWQSGDNSQKLYFLYNPAVVRVKKEKVLLSKLYSDIVAGNATLPNYPHSNSATFWASGRLPYLVQFEVNLNGITQTVNVVNIHAKANSGDDMQQYERRKYDVQVLKDSLDAQYANTNLVLLGDYNDDVDISVVGTNNASTYEAFVVDAGYAALTYELSVADAATYQSGSLRSFLDHIIISEPLTQEYISSSVQVEEKFLNTITDFRETTSDHVPVSARFDLSVTPVATFAQSSLTVGEDAGSVMVNLALSEAQAAAQTITITTQPDATATASDYTIAGMERGKLTLAVPAGATTTSFTLAVLDDNVFEPTKEVQFQISFTSANLAVGVQAVYSLLIEDNDNTTGIADATKGQFKVYPNPADAAVRLILPERVAKQQTIRLAVHGMDGKAHLIVNGTQENAQQVLNAALAKLPKGIYLLQVIAGEEVFQSRMLKH